MTVDKGEMSSYVLCENTIFNETEKEKRTRGMSKIMRS